MLISLYHVVSENILSLGLLGFVMVPPVRTDGAVDCNGGLDVIKPLHFIFRNDSQIYKPCIVMPEGKRMFFAGLSEEYALR